VRPLGVGPDGRGARADCRRPVRILGRGQNRVPREDLVVAGEDLLLCRRLRAGGCLENGDAGGKGETGKQGESKHRGAGTWHVTGTSVSGDDDASEALRSCRLSLGIIYSLFIPIGGP